MPSRISRKSKKHDSERGYSNGVSTKLLGPKTADSGSDHSHATVLADKIESYIYEHRLPNDTFVGTEEELCERYEVGLAMLRQAEGLLQQRGVAYLRRGKSGGLYVKSDKINASSKILATYLCFTEASVVDLRPISDILIRSMFQQVAPKMNISKVREFRAKLDAFPEIETFALGGLYRMIEWRNALADIADNPAFSLFHHTIVNSVAYIVPFEKELPNERQFETQVSRRISQGMIDALATNDFCRFLDVHSENVQFVTSRLQIWQAAGERSAPTESLQLSKLKGQDKLKLPELVARAILRDIQNMGWPDGEKLGTEAELIKRYGVSISTFRQAICLLEEYNAVSRRRGKSGGLAVATPNFEMSVKGVIEALMQSGVRADQVRPLQVEFQLGAIRLLLETGSMELLRDIEDLIKKSKKLKGLDLRRSLHEASLSRVRSSKSKFLSMLFEIYSNVLSPLQISDEISDEEIRNTFTETMGGFVKAAAAGDNVLAQCAMRQYLAEETKWLSVS